MIFLGPELGRTAPHRIPSAGIRAERHYQNFGGRAIILCALGSRRLLRITMRHTHLSDLARDGLALHIRSRSGGAAKPGSSEIAQLTLDFD